MQLIPNAVDVARFRTPRERPADMPAAPVALYPGTLHEDRLDIDLCIEVARALPELDLVLVGPDCLSPTSRRRL
ncbi:MAG TPA: hypothetical protein VEH82_00615, partial [Acidimicrobiales bacterium]|nr:hypothetical protein [Acidimicrobiales bacterium]